MPTTSMSASNIKAITDHPTSHANNQQLDESPIVRTHYAENSVLALRAYEIAQSTKPFMARGYKLKRCQRCLLAERLCVCQDVKIVESKHRMLLIMYRGEAIKPSNTGRLIAEVLPNTLAFQWSRTAENTQLIEAIEDKNYKSYLVFPALYANNALLNAQQGTVGTIKRDVVTQFAENDKQPKQFILLDGTWSEAKKMFRKSPYLNHLPLLSFDDLNLTDYLLRDASREEQHGTASAAMAALHTAGDEEASEALRVFTLKFMQNYISIKAR